MSLTPEQARAAATGYGWSVLPHDNGGFHAEKGHHQIAVTFNEDGSFRCAFARDSDDGMATGLTQEALIGQFAQRGHPLNVSRREATP